MTALLSSTLEPAVPVLLSPRMGAYRGFHCDVAAADDLDDDLDDDDDDDDDLDDDEEEWDDDEDDEDWDDEDDD